MIWVYLAGVATTPVLVAVIGGGYLFIRWATAREIGAGPCVACDHSGEWEIGERTNLYAELSFAWHRWRYSTRPWHKAAVARARAKYD